jgi:hypothetical protein
MSTHTPYTYLIGWSSTNKFYYGVRYAKKCNPSELFISYFTSSKHVKSYMKKHGNPDIIQNYLENGWEEFKLKGS